jgi:hypothetical protein
MKLPNWFKIIWWTALLSLTTWTLFKRYNAIIDGHSVPFDALVFLVWVALMLAPIFNEVSLFGLRFKQAIDELKQQLTEVRNEIHNKIMVSSTINLTPPTDQKIQETEEKYKIPLDEILKELGVKFKEQKIEIGDIPENNQFLFSIRFKLEQELRRIWRRRINNQIRQISLLDVMRDLWVEKVIDDKIFEPMRQVIAVCNYGIHGEDVSTNQISFVKRFGPKLISFLTEIE